MKHELLSPAGNIEAGYAALFYGADAVYLGLNKFSARANADNFTFDELNEFTAYAHHLHRRVFVALNTILSDDEIDELPATFSALDKAKVDGIIVQDLGVAYLIKKFLPDVELHASTQMAVHNLEAAKFLYEQGFKRVVLARELTLNEIKKIAEALPDLDLEVFIHGALCYSYSGQCLFSALEYGMSANRGRCVYPCRAEFSVDGCKKLHLFSMKDLALEEKVLQIPSLSLKIEGRKKSPLYVAAVTNYYRHLLDGKKKDLNEADDIKQIFSRPWCNFHFNGKDKDVVDENFVGHRGLLIGKVQNITKNRLQFKTSHKIARYDGLQIDVVGDEKPFGFGIKNLFMNGKSEFEVAAKSFVEVELPKERPVLNVGAPIYLASSSEVKGKYDYKKPKIGEYKNAYPLAVKIEIEKEKIWAMAENTAVFIAGNFEPAQNTEKTVEAAQKSFNKTGGTDFSLQSLEVFNPHNLFIPASVLNDLRRKLFDAVKVEEKHFDFPKVLPAKEASEPQEIRIFPLDFSSSVEKWQSLRDKDERWCVLPHVCRNTEKLEQIIKQFYDAGVRKFVAENYYAFEILKKYKDIKIMSGSFIYVMNRYAAEYLRELGVCQATIALEISPENTKKLLMSSPLPLIQVIRARPPLFTSAVCIRENKCKDCKGGTKYYTLKKDGREYEAKSQDCQTEVFAKNLYEREKIIGANGYFSNPKEFL